MLRDADRAPAAITFDFDPSELSKEDDPKEVEVTATLDVGKASQDLTFSFKDVSGTPGGGDKLRCEYRRLWGSLNKDAIAGRDVYYDELGGFGDLTIEEGESTELDNGYP